MILLNKPDICLRLGDLAQKVHLHLFESIDSTNQYLKELPLQDQIDICCAEMQTKGRGRFSREWHSPFAENIYFSGRWPIKMPLYQLSTLSLVVCLAVKAVLDSQLKQNEILIKWPNDLIWRDKKLCGILIELMHEPTSQLTAIIGIGLNINSKTNQDQIQAKLDRPWCSLLEITGKAFNRNELIAQLIIQLNKTIQQFKAEGFKAFQSSWQQWDYLKGRQIKVSQTNRFLSGIANGIDQQGQLLLIDEHGTEHTLMSGEASLQMQP